VLPHLAAQVAALHVAEDLGGTLQHAAGALLLGHVLLDVAAQKGHVGHERLVVGLQAGRIAQERLDQAVLRQRALDLLARPGIGARDRRVEQLLLDRGVRVELLLDPAEDLTAPLRVRGLVELGEQRLDGAVVPGDQLDRVHGTPPRSAW
jgi:hypothetical protein